MQTARIDDAQEIAAQEFARLPEQQRHELKGRLTCPNRECGAPAHFRNRSRNGIPALFYAGQHAPKCLHRSTWPDGISKPGESIEDQAVWNNASELVLRFDPDGAPRNTVVEGEDSGAPAEGRRHTAARGERTSQLSSIGLRPLLRRLRDDPTFRESGMLLTLSNGTRGTIAEMCGHTSEGAGRLGERRVMWGPVYASRGYWINSAPKEVLHLAVRVPHRVLTGVLALWGVDALEDLSSTVAFDFIVEGVLHETANNTPYVTLESVDHLAVLPHGSEP